ncbi:MAG: hypothetical protein ACXV8R_14710 [Acidimicrobiia bacterium]
MVWWRRSDADLVRDVPDLRRIMPYVMRTRNESTVYFEQRVDVGNAERFVRAFNEVHPETRTTLFHVLLWSCRQGLAEFPNVNRFVSGGRLYQRRGIWISYSAKQRMKKGAPLVVLKREFDPDEPFATMVGEMLEQLHTAKFSSGTNTVDGELKLVLMLPGFLRRVVFAAYRVLEANGMFPRSFIENDPLYATMFLTDLGSLGLDPVFHHLYEYGNVGVFGVLGRARAEQVPDPDSGRLERRRIAMIRWSFDERIEDGLYAGYGIKQVKKLLEDPVKGGITAGDDAVRAVFDRDGAADAERA